MGKTNRDRMNVYRCVCGGGFAKEWARGCDQFTGGFRIFIIKTEVNQIKTQRLQRPGKFEGRSLREQIRAAGVRVPTAPRTETPTRRPTSGAQQPRGSPCSFSPSLLSPKGNAGSSSARDSSISRGGKGGGERRRAAGGGVSPPRGALGGAAAERPSPRALIAVAPCPSPPACVCEGERVRCVGPMGVIEGFGDAERRFPLPSE